MNSGLEIARAFVRARWLSGRSAQRLRAERRRSDDLKDLPIETSLQFDQHFSERNVLGLTVEQARAAAERELAGEPSAYPGYSWGLSTGTMGAAGLFLTSERERNQWIGTVLGKFLPLRMLAGSDIALVLKRNNRLYTDVRKTRRLRLHYFDAEVPVDGWASQVCDLAPRVLIGPPSVLEQIAQSAAFARNPWRPELLLTGAEPLFPQDRALLEQAYGASPRVIYQAKEGFLAAGCASGRIHLNEDLIHFERLALEQGRFVPVITDFTRTSQQYRRYRLDDVLVASPRSCPCGQAFANVSAVEGRANDVLLFGNERVFPLQVNEIVLGYLGGSRDYRVTQVAPERMTIAVEGGVPLELVEAFKQRLPMAQISIEEYEVQNPGEKRRRVRRLFDLHNEWLNRLTVARNVPRGS